MHPVNYTTDQLLYFISYVRTEYIKKLPLEETCKVQLFPDEGLAGDRVRKDHDPKTWRPRNLHEPWQKENKYEDTAGGSNQKVELKSD